MADFVYICRLIACFFVVMFIFVLFFLKEIY